MQAERKESPSPSGEGLGWGAESEEARLARFAREMRSDPTEWEKRVWRQLSNRQLVGFKFRRQAVIGRYIVDFFCPAIGLIVEIDGNTHDQARDAIRDERLRCIGLTVLRFSNIEVSRNMEGVLASIREVAQSLPPRTTWRLPHPNPSPEGEGL